MNKSIKVNKISYDAKAIYRWVRLPTIADYEDIEELNDIENTETILYQASRKISW